MQTKQQMGSERTDKMGCIRHNAIVITSRNPGAIVAAADKAHEIGLQVLGPAPSVINGYRSLMICPDGSKEGWMDSNIGDRNREAFRAWLDTQRLKDGSSNFEWAEIAYGADDAAAAVTASAWTPLPATCKKDLQDD